MIVIFTLDAHISENGPKQFQGMERYEARKAVVAQLEAEQFLVKVEPHKMMQPGRPHRRGAGTHADRPVVRRHEQAGARRHAEPGKSITQVALEVVADGRIQFYPDNWTTIYNQWLNNIQDWCISRQLWWATRSPPGTRKTARCSSPQRGRSHRTGPRRRRDRRADARPDVLDTWFSSGLVPFTTLGWPRTRRTCSATCRPACWSRASTSSSSGSPAWSC